MRKVVIVICTILGMIIGVLIGEVTQGISYLKWLSIGGEIGFQNPIVLDLNFLKITLGLWCKVSIGGAIFMLLFAFLSQKLTRWLKL